MLKNLSIRFVLTIALGTAVVLYIALPVLDRLVVGWFNADVELRARLVAHSVEDRVAELLDGTDKMPLERFLRKIALDERLLGVAVCQDNAAVSLHLPAPLAQTTPCDPTVGTRSGVLSLNGTESMHYYRAPEARTPSGVAFRLVVVHDLRFVVHRQLLAREHLFVFAVIAALTLSFLATVAAWILVRQMVSRLIKDIRGRRFFDEASGVTSIQPVLSQVRQVLREIERDQRQEIELQENWTPSALRHVLDRQLGSPQVIVLSNRQPYTHLRQPDGSIAVQIPASGMVTAIEPVTRACGGTWVAHGSGDADRDTVDRKDRVDVPPNDPAYKLRRVWLDAAEEEGYYYGFSNEGLWPLCHLAYVRPAFREADWRMYVAVNRRFSSAVAEEATQDNPLVLVQDFHFSLAPALIREKLPNSTIALFWHIPWPNVETFGVCPWKKELLAGMLQADILGFHTRYHCQNFLATVDRFMECQIDHEHMTVQVAGHVCHVGTYPISIEWPPKWLETVERPTRCRADVSKRHGLPSNALIGIGIERWDFTKGILERFLAIESLLESNPKYHGRLVFLQIAAPTRSKLSAYAALQRATVEAVERINGRFATARWQPIVLIGQHHAPPQVFELMRAADFCVVNSLHDGMNLVAKEFVAARDDEDGVLILSTFAGASRELTEALLVNPFSIGETAAAISCAIGMSRNERRERMAAMRQTVAEKNVYRWAGRILMDAARIRRQEVLRRGTVGRK